MIDLPDLRFSYHAHAKSGMIYHALYLPIMEFHHVLKNRKAASAVHGMSRLQTTRPPTDNNISLVFQVNQIPNDIRVQERHITGSEENMLRLRQLKARVQSAKASAVWNKIADHGYFCSQGRTVLSDDNVNLLKQFTENSTASFKESPLTDEDTSLVLSHPPTLSPGQ
ncbi:MAG: hypothetical protein P0119_18565 [Nitrospira sp.]|nr:hypothetical protein [Nitrospira sp.]